MDRVGRGEEREREGRHEGRDDKDGEEEYGDRDT